MKREITHKPLVPPGAAEIARRNARRRPYLVTAFAIALVAFWFWIPSETRSALVRELLVHRGLLASLIGFLLVALSLLWAKGQELDNRVFLFINLWGRRPLWLDGLMWLATQVGNGLTAFLVAFWQLQNGNRSFGYALILGTLSLSLIVEGIKVLTNRARPFLTNKKARVVGWREPGRSFPSGHTAQAFFMMTMLANHFQAGLGVAAILFGAATLVGVTRVYLGAHYPRDVIGGTVLGLGWGIFVTLVDPLSFIHLPF